MFVQNTNHDPYGRNCVRQDSNLFVLLRFVCVGTHLVYRIVWHGMPRSAEAGKRSPQLVNSTCIYSLSFHFCLLGARWQEHLPWACPLEWLLAIVSGNFVYLTSQLSLTTVASVINWFFLCHFLFLVITIVHHRSIRVERLTSSWRRTG